MQIEDYFLYKLQGSANLQGVYVLHRFLSRAPGNFFSSLWELQHCLFIYFSHALKGITRKECFFLMQHRVSSTTTMPTTDTHQRFLSAFDNHSVALRDKINHLSAAKNPGEPVLVPVLFPSTFDPLVCKGLIPKASSILCSAFLHTPGHSCGCSTKQMHRA